MGPAFWLHTGLGASWLGTRSEVEAGSTPSVEVVEIRKQCWAQRAPVYGPRAGFVGGRALQHVL